MIIQKGIQEFTGFNETYAKLLKYGLSPRQIQMLLDTYDNVLDVIEEDCFKPYYEVYGFGYKTACKMASAIGLSNEDPRRLMPISMSWLDNYPWQLEIHILHLRQSFKMYVV